MKTFKLAASLFVSASLLSSVAIAHARTVMKDEVLPVATITAPYNWTGFYAGLNIGAVQHTMNINDDQAAAFFATIKQVGNPAFTGGFQVGYRRQLDLTKTSGIYGIEFSTEFANVRFKNQYGSSFGLYQLNATNELKNYCLLQLIGGIAADRTLLFVAAGLSWSNLAGNVTNLNGVPFFNSFSVNKKVLGTSIGGGLEYAFTDHISARFKVDVITPKAYTSYDNIGNSYLVSNSITQGTFGVSYKF
jgi:outer membrane immunogenic protein